MVITFSARNFRFTYSTHLGVMCHIYNRCVAARPLLMAIKASNLHSRKISPSTVQAANSDSSQLQCGSPPRDRRQS